MDRALQDCLPSPAAHSRPPPSPSNDQPPQRIVHHISRGTRPKRCDAHHHHQPDNYSDRQHMHRLQHIQMHPRRPMHLSAHSPAIIIVLPPLQLTWQLPPGNTMPLCPRRPTQGREIQRHLQRPPHRPLPSHQLHIYAPTELTAAEPARGNRTRERLLYTPQPRQMPPG